jgi:cytochrome c biogenesis protein CcmG/thiol:disulfide interchange protein DsbE
MDAAQGPDAAAVPAAPNVRSGASRLRTVLVLAVVAVLVTFVAWYVDQPSGSSNVRAGKPPPGAPPRAGDAPRDFSATAIDGTAVSMAALKGKPTWLTIGASWCPDCRAEAMDLQATYAKYQPQGLAVVGVFIEEDEKAVSDYAKRVGFTFPMVADPRGAIADLYRVYGIPIHFFIGRDGTIRDVRIGRLTPGDMEQLVQRIVNG